MELRWDDFCEFIKEIYNLSEIKWYWTVEEDLRDGDPVFDIKKDPLAPRWAADLQKFKDTGNSKDVDDVIHLILTDLCCQGHLEPGRYHFYLS